MHKCVRRVDSTETITVSELEGYLWLEIDDTGDYNYGSISRVNYCPICGFKGKEHKELKGDESE